ncbi:MAG: single-stranded-DNA-specific exonuclease RecJ [Acidobacteria bacterium]|nr:single-stranded-DNA-specific exonuclease RecJ [Acidobacteriota bacterium]
MTPAPHRRAQWIVPRLDPDGELAVSRFASELGLAMPAALVLWNRGVRDTGAARRFLNPSLDSLHDPALMRDMDRAAARLHGAVQSGEKILLYGDYDVDGTTSIVILKKAIELAGGAADYFVPHRVRDGYGMKTEVIEQAARDGVHLIVSVDTGIRANAVVAHAREHGIDVIVTDHHLPESELPPALAVLNPNRPDCAYPHKDLCGAGVTFKLVQALLSRLDWPEVKRRRLLESFLKLVAVATVADVVPLTGENRDIVRCGLEGFDDVRNIGLRELMAAAGFKPGDRPTARQVAFRIAPRINAAGRMANASDVIELFLTSDAARAAELAGQLNDLNKERQETESRIVEEILRRCLEEPVGDDQAALVFADEGWHKGVVGIVASRVVERFHRPAFVLSVDSEKGEASGSGRSVAGFHLLDALESMPELFTRFGGHKQAAGVTLPMERVDLFRARLAAYAGTLLGPADFRARHEVDAVISGADLRDDVVGQLFGLAPFGHGNPSPRFVLMDAEVQTTAEVWKEKHVRPVLRHQGRTVVFKGWNMAGRVAEFERGARLDVLFEIEEDSYTGWSAVLKDARPAGG